MPKPKYSCSQMACLNENGSQCDAKSRKETQLQKSMPMPKILPGQKKQLSGYWLRRGVVQHTPAQCTGRTLMMISPTIPPGLRNLMRLRRVCVCCVQSGLCAWMGKLAITTDEPNKSWQGDWWEGSFRWTAASRSGSCKLTSF